MGGVETHDEESVWSVDLTADLEGGGGVTGHDQVWFEGIFRTHAPAVHRYFVRRTHVGEVDDLTAETFVVAWRRRASSWTTPIAGSMARWSGGACWR